MLRWARGGRQDSRTGTSSVSLLGHSMTLVYVNETKKHIKTQHLHVHVHAVVLVDLLAVSVIPQPVVMGECLIEQGQCSSLQQRQCATAVQSSPPPLKPQGRPRPLRQKLKAALSRRCRNKQTNKQTHKEQQLHGFRQQCRV